MNDVIADAPGDASPALPRVEPETAVAPGSAPTLWLYTATTFVSALLLFSVQPMFAKMVLPVLGGSPSVWAVAMCFFQAALLAGYVYAHLLIRFLPPRAGGFVHLSVFAVALVALPIGIPASWHEPPAGDPYLWQMSLFAIAIGPPFFAVAANAPLLQAWFARSGHPHGRDPYFLYAASNLGSLLALLSYPFVLEPTLGLQALSRTWAGGFLVLWAMIGGLLLHPLSACAMRACPRSTRPARRPRRRAWLARLGWVGLAFVPSALLTAFTNHVTTDVASAPLLWVLPLALYLLTFVLVVSRALPDPAADPAAAAPGRGRRSARAAVADAARGLVRHLVDRRDGVFRLRDGGAPHAVRVAAGAAVSHRVLYLDVASGACWVVCSLR